MTPFEPVLTKGLGEFDLNPIDIGIDAIET